MHEPDQQSSPDRATEEEARMPSRVLSLGKRRRPELTNLRQRIYLTYRYRGLRSLLYRALTFPVRFTPLKRHLRLAPKRPDLTAAARAWYRENGQPVSIVIPSYRDTESVINLVASIRTTTDRTRTRIIIADDASGAEHVAALRALEGVEIIEGVENGGFARNVNRGLRAAGSEDDVVILNSDMLTQPGWLESLQFAANQAEAVGIVGAKLLYDDDRIQFGGSFRHPTARQWFDHRYRFRPAGWGPANIAQPVMAVTGACMYVKHEVIQRVGLLDEAYPMAYEDVDFCLRAWQSGFQVIYWPAAELYHLESATRGVAVGEREQRSQAIFWNRWSEFFDERRVTTETGALRVIYITEDTGVGGGHRDIFEHLDGLLARGHDAELWTLGDPPDWFDLQAPVRTFANYAELVNALAPERAIKIATWWNTAAPVWQASVLEGIPVYFVQDIETSYYAKDSHFHDAVLASYRGEFRYMTISSWNRDRLRELGHDAVLIPPGIDLDNFRPLPEVSKREDMILALGRSNPLKNLPLTIRAWRRLPKPRPELCLFGIEPELADEPGIRYIDRPSDEEVNRLFNEATVFVQTSTHEGFCLPALEAMATGGSVVCTDAHGNRDFCVDGQNCLMPAANEDAVASAMSTLLSDSDLRNRLGAAGILTAREYGWDYRIDALERFLTDIAAPQPVHLLTDALPQVPQSRLDG